MFCGVMVVARIAGENPCGRDKLGDERPFLLPVPLH